MSAFPKLVALDTDWTIFSGLLDETIWGKGPGAIHKLADNIQRVDDRLLRDRSNHAINIRLYQDIPKIVHHILKNGASLAIVSRNTSKALCDRALYYFKAVNPTTAKEESIIKMVRYDEVVDEPKTEHFKRIHGWSKLKYTDMILFDADPDNDIVETALGVTIQLCGGHGQKGLTWDVYSRGIDLWRRNKGIISPYLGQDLNLYPNKKFIGYAALNGAAVKLLESGKRHEVEVARWGYGLYLVDNPAIAKFLKDRMERDHVDAHICAIWVRDAQLFDGIAKIWVPEDNNLMTDSQGQISWSQEERNQKIERYGVQKPYVLFSKHNIDDMPISQVTTDRWNEMVIYPQVQDALLLAYRMSDTEIQDAIQNPKTTSFFKLIPEWNITVPPDTLADFAAHGESPLEPSSSANQLSIAHFNDVYQVSEQKIQVDGQVEKIDVTKFATLLFDIKDKWKVRADGKRDGLIIFSGDLFSPSVESSTTRGGHMASVINALDVDVSVAGNHEFDFGYPQLSKLIGDTAFPWLLSNIIDTNTNKVPEPMKEFHVLERGGIRIGFVGLVEKDWIATITGWPSNFKFQDMAKVGKDLSVILRNPDGPYKCDIIIALTHSRIPNDILLATDLFALSPAAQANKDIASEHGVDILLGGHDHVYWISKGVSAWEGYDVQRQLPEATTDQGDSLIVKSGTDFQDLSEVVLTLKDTSSGSVRKKVIQDIKGKRHVTRGSTPVNGDMKKIIDVELTDIKEAMKEPICITAVKLDVRSEYIRHEESPIGNWVADSLRHVYNAALVKLGHQGTDGVIICTGDLRGDKIYPPGEITQGDLMTILPYPDVMVVRELDAKALWETLESGLSKWPVQEGRFPAISGFRVSWNSSNEPGKRVFGIWLQEESKEMGPDGKPKVIDKEEVLRTSQRKYIIMIGQYMADGGDGYDVLKAQKIILGEENGQSKSALIKKFLLGAHYMNKMAHDTDATGSASRFLHPETADVLTAARQRIHLSKFNVPSVPHIPSSASQNITLSPPSIMRSTHPLDASGAAHTLEQSMSRGRENLHDVVENIVTPSLKWLASKDFYASVLKVAEHEDMGILDPYERRRLLRFAATSGTRLASNISLRMMSMDRSGLSDVNYGQDKEDDTHYAEAQDKEVKRDLPVIHPVVDGRFKDVAGHA